MTIVKQMDSRDGATDAIQWKGMAGCWVLCNCDYKVVERDNFYLFVDTMGR
jgi:hypothetical protein